MSLSWAQNSLSLTKTEVECMNMDATKKIETILDSFGEQISNLQLRIESLEFELAKANKALLVNDNKDKINLTEDEIKMIYSQF